MNDAPIREIAGFPGYFIGSDGKVWSQPGVDVSGGKSPELKRARTLRRPYGAKYCVVCLRAVPGGKISCRYVHRLVLEAFVGPCPEGMQALHGDGDTANNDLSNLRWGTPAENAADKERHGTHPRGEQSPNASLTEKEVKIIKRLLECGLKQYEIAEMFEVPTGVIFAIADGKTWKHVA